MSCSNVSRTGCPSAAPSSTPSSQPATVPLNGGSSGGSSSSSSSSDSSSSAIGGGVGGAIAGIAVIGAAVAYVYKIGPFAAAQITTDSKSSFESANPADGTVVIRSIFGSAQGGKVQGDKVQGSL
jgi:hypothetical protein